jgi:hypothetical protein
MASTHRATLYLEPALHRAIKVKAAETNTPMSELVNRALRQALREDALDLAAFKERAKEPARAFEAVLDGLRRDGLL